jgi:uncharacterized protein involved in tolerance to divalent cations
LKSETDDLLAVQGVSVDAVVLPQAACGVDETASAVIGQPVYRWDATVHQAAEARASLRSRRACSANSPRSSSERHPYEVPNITAVGVFGRNPTPSLARTSTLRPRVTSDLA